MRWKINFNGYIEDDEGNIVLVIPKDADPKDIELAINAPAMFQTMLDFCDDVENGGLRAKKHYAKFKNIRDKILND